MKTESIKTINDIAKANSLPAFDFTQPITDELYRQIHDLLDEHVEKNRENLGEDGISEIDIAFIDLANQRKIDNS